MNQPSTLSRRRFLAVAGGGAVAGVTVASLPLSFANQAAAVDGPRSLVCVFLAGGADSFNMFIPLDHGEAGQTHDVYRATRGDFAVPANQILPVGDGAFGFHPGMVGMAERANRDQVAVVTNVGPLERPITLEDYRAGRSVPQTLFAHDSQQKLWETGRATLTSDRGWGGSVAAAVGDGSPLPPAFSISGSNRWQASPDAGYARLSATVSVERLVGYDASLRSWLPTYEGIEQVLNLSLVHAASSPNRFHQAMAETMVRSVATTEALQAASQPTPENDVGMDDVAATPLGGQLQLVARLIKNRDALGMPRQIFFVRLGGWDTHGQQQERFPVLIDQLDTALTSFHDAIDELGFNDSVTSFTASDFGRTLTSNGDGTDHGWGGHAFVTGGAVKGGRYGTFPRYSVDNNPDDVGDRTGAFAGRLIPTTSVAQHGATLARWMGLSDQQLDQAFPDLANFGTRDLGFL